MLPNQPWEERPFRACPEPVEGEASSPTKGTGFSPCRSPRDRSHAANAFGVDTPTSGVTTTQAIDGKSGSGYTCSPRPTPNTVPPTRNSGRSDPTSAAIRNFSAPGSAFFSARSSPSSVATAFAEAPPSPPCTGSRFSISMSTRPLTRSALHRLSFQRCGSRCIRFVPRHARIRALNLDLPVPTPHAHTNHIMRSPIV